ncbi:hypothetical protein BASA62_006228 [Batrachochytrium salamandrivorans]|nr:hypothetical protein BASA62_006228 [Batrachochytrium salamandrivorans]
MELDLKELEQCCRQYQSHRTVLALFVYIYSLTSPTVDNIYNVPLPHSTLCPLCSHSISLNLSTRTLPHSGAVSSSFSEKDDVKTATDYISNKLNLGTNDFKVFDSFTDTAGVTHVYGSHMVNDVRIANHQAAAHVKNGQVTSFSSSFGTARHFSKRDLAVSEAKATLDFEGASATASAQLGIPVYSEFEHALEYVEQPDGKIAYAYKLQLRNNPVTKWVQVWCDATTGKVIQAVDFAHKASYKAIPIPRRDATEGFSMVSDPESWGASPSGWSDGKATDGNNVITSNPQCESVLPSNVMHDISYQYGFTESAGNFQTNNFGKGGQGSDAATINVLNPSNSNDANFLRSR